MSKHQPWRGILTEIEEGIGPRWVVVEIRSEYDGKNTDAAIYPCIDKVDADDLAERINESNLDIAYVLGGYPDGAWVLDLTDPDSFEDTEQRVEELDERDVEFGDDAEEGA